MIVLAIRTDSSTSHLLVSVDGSLISEISWESGRQLAKDLLSKISELCLEASVSINSIGGVICYLGPGSFTGLRIGITVGNTIAYSNNIPIVGTTGEHWLEKGLDRLSQGDDEKLLVPEYGSEPNITL